jgi:RNA polymerase sigma-70 factor, ECF subfamily
MLCCAHCRKAGAAAWRFVPAPEPAPPTADSSCMSVATMGADMLEAVSEADAGGLRKAGFTEEALPWLDAVYRFSLRLTAGDQDEAQDLVQETFLRAYRHWETFTPGSNARSWLFTICRHAHLRSRERQSRRPETPVSRLEITAEALAGAALFHELDESDPERDLFRTLSGAHVHRAIAGLPDEFREAVVLGDIEDLPYAEIASILEVPIGTVKSRLFRGRRLLAEALRSHAHDMDLVQGDAR